MGALFVMNAARKPAGAAAVVYAHSSPADPGEHRHFPPDLVLHALLGPGRLPGQVILGQSRGQSPVGQGVTADDVPPREAPDLVPREGHPARRISPRAGAGGDTVVPGVFRLAAGRTIHEPGGDEEPADEPVPL